MNITEFKQTPYSDNLETYYKAIVINEDFGWSGKYILTDDVKEFIIKLEKGLPFIPSDQAKEIKDWIKEFKKRAK